MDKMALTSLSDWPLFVVLGGIIVTLLVMIWQDLKHSIREYRAEYRSDLKEVWNAIHEILKNK